jgi:D-serine deaminase-like pyridoxal phosphate-dependent protein
MNVTLQQKADLATPCLVLDLEILDQNLRKMQTLTERAGKVRLENQKPLISTLAIYRA